MEITPELVNKKIKEYWAIAEKYKETDNNKYLYNKGKARGLIELMRDTFVHEKIQEIIKENESKDLAGKPFSEFEE